MLPNVKFMICGILFCFLLFAVTGAGVMPPDSRTRVGEMPEIGRPMMQRSIAEVPAQSQFYMTTVARRSDGLERLRERASMEIAASPTQPEPDLPKPAVMAEVTPEGSPGGDVEAPVQVPAAETRSDDRPDEARPPQDAALAPPAAKDNESAPLPVNVPLPPPRPAVFNGLHRHVRMLHRRHRVAPQSDTAGQAVAAGQNSGQGVPTSQGVAAGYTASRAASR
jgi:hypothetical protein